MTERLRTAIVLAGGPGIRLKPVTDRIPKAMVEVSGKPLLEWVLEWLAEYQVNHVVIGVAYMKENIIEYFGDGARFGLKVQYSNHTVEGGTGEGFRMATRFAEEDNFFAMNGDQITDLDLRDLQIFHLKHNLPATIAVTSPPCPYGHIEIDSSSTVIGFREKPMCPVAVCSTGIYVFNKAVIPYLPEKGDVERDTFPKLAQKGLLKAYNHQGQFVTVNTTKDLEQAEFHLKGLSSS